MSDCDSMSTPMLLSFNYDLHEFNNLSYSNQSYVQNFPYNELIRSLMHLGVCNRPEIAFAVNTFDDSLICLI